jgi:hypothetical protein
MSSGTPRSMQYCSTWGASRTGLTNGGGTSLFGIDGGNILARFARTKDVHDPLSGLGREFHRQDTKQTSFIDLSIGCLVLNSRLFASGS